jgi:hypothetical protein
MIKKALLEGIEKGAIAGEELYNLDDQSLFFLLKEKKTGSSLAELVWNGRLYSVAAEIPFNQADHAGLKDITKRSLHEEQLAGDFRRAGIPFGDNDLIIDVPEPVSFETGLFVPDENRSFTESSSAFKATTLDSFIKTLYTIRVFINPDFYEKVETLTELSAILNTENLRLHS